MLTAILEANITTLVISITSVLIFLVLVLMLNLHGLRTRTDRERVQMLAKIDHLNSEIRAVVKADVGIGKRIIKVERRVMHLSHRQEDLFQEVRYKIESDYGEEAGSQQISGAQKLVAKSDEKITDISSELSKEERSLSKMFVSMSEA